LFTLTDTLSFRDIQVLKTYGAAPYLASLKKLEKDVKDLQTRVNEKIGELPPIDKNYEDDLLKDLF